MEGVVMSIPPTGAGWDWPGEEEGVGHCLWGSGSVPFHRGLVSSGQEVEGKGSGAPAVVIPFHWGWFQWTEGERIVCVGGGGGGRGTL